MLAVSEALPVLPTLSNKSASMIGGLFNKLRVKIAAIWASFCRAFQALISSSPVADKTRAFTTEEKQNFIEEFRRRFPKSDPGPLREITKVKANGHVRSELIADNPFAKGGEHLVQFAATISRAGGLKYFARKTPIKSSNHVDVDSAANTLPSLIKDKRPFMLKNHPADSTGASHEKIAEITLSTALREKKVANQAELAFAILDAYIKLWEAGDEEGMQLLHLDAKLENILLDKEGKPYITDFGFSKKVRKESQGLSHLTKGTAHAMPFGVVDPITKKWQKVNLLHADFHAVGILLLEICLGRHFGGEARTKVFKEQILHYENLYTTHRDYLIEKVKEKNEDLAFIVSSLIYDSAEVDLEILNILRGNKTESS
ncbi:MAG: protein kinase domain-containing protein [Chlamydiia bacterium]